MSRQFVLRRLALEKLEVRLPLAVIPFAAGSDFSETVVDSGALFCRPSQLVTLANPKPSANTDPMSTTATWNSFSGLQSLRNSNLLSNATQATEMIVDNTDLGYVETGFWVNSLIKGQNGTSTRFSKEYNATATWNAPYLVPGYYSVSIWKVAIPTNSSNAHVSIVHNGITEPTQSVNLSTVGAGYVSLGTFFFSGAPGEFIRLSQGSTVGILRADAVRFTPAVAANSAPIISGPVSQAVSGNTQQNFSNRIVLADADAGLAPVQLSLSVSNGFLTLPIANGVSLLSGTNGGANMTVLGTLADLNEALISLVYQPLPNFSGTDAIHLALNDLGNSGSGGPKSAIHSIALTVSNPIFIVDNGTPGYVEANAWVNSAIKGSNGSSTRFANGLNATATWNRPDFEAGYYEVAIWKVAVPSNSAHARITIVHNGIIEPIQTINLSTPGSTFVTLGTYFFDGAPGEFVRLSQGTTIGNLRADADRFTRSPTALNKPPTINAPTAQSIESNKSLVFSSTNGNSIMVADADAGNSQVELLLRASNGLLSLGSTEGLSFLPDGGIRVQGTLTRLNAALNGLRYQPNLNFIGSDSLQLTIKDLGNSGIGGPQSVKFTIAIQVIEQVFIVDSLSSGYSETGAWVNSALTGFNGTSTRFTNALDATATWNAPNLSPGFYTVAIWKIAVSTNATSAKITVVHNNITEAPLTIDLSIERSKFVELGTFFFSGMPGERVRLSQGNISGNLRANAVRFTKIN